VVSLSSPKAPQQPFGLLDRLHLLIALQQPRQFGEVRGHAVGLVTGERPGLARDRAA
jgi:hypothetical protein